MRMIVNLLFIYNKNSKSISWVFSIRTMLPLYDLNLFSLTGQHDKNEALSYGYI